MQAAQAHQCLLFSCGALHVVQAIGAAGAAALLSAVAARGKANARPGGKVTVLTHCNTGSLATAGYGTALGVVRALHEQGKLERCYACETRPYNQGEQDRHAWGSAAALLQQRCRFMASACNTLLAFLMPGSLGWHWTGAAVQQKRDSSKGLGH
jgi:hypothetical protein